MKILTISLFLSVLLPVQAREWTNTRGDTVTAVLRAVRDSEVDLQLLNGNMVTVAKEVFCGADQDYMLQWQLNGGTLQDPDAEKIPDTPNGDKPYGPVEPNWFAPWPAKIALPDYLLVKTVQESPELSVYDSDRFVFEYPGILPSLQRDVLVRRFETALSALAALPLNLTIAQRPSRKYLVRVCSQEQDFKVALGLQHGDMKFSPTGFTVHLQPQKEGFSVPDPRFAVTHWVAQSMELPHWLVDALAGYIALIPKDKETLLLQNTPAQVAKRLPAAMRKGKTPLPALNDILTKENTHTHIRHDLEQENVHDWAGILWLTYWVHLASEEQKTNFRLYLKTCFAQDPGESYKILQNSATLEQLQADFKKAWAKFGLRLKHAVK